MSNETSAAPKSFYLSKTFWLNIVAALSMAVPMVRDWLATNPVPVVAAFAAAGVLLRFVTHGKISLGGDSENRKSPGGSGGALPLGIFLLASICLISLPSCSANYPVDGQLFYRESNTGAKGGLTFSPGESPRGFLRLPFFNQETGELIGRADLSAPLIIQATK